MQVLDLDHIHLSEGRKTQEKLQKLQSIQLETAKIYHEGKINAGKFSCINLMIEEKKISSG